MKKLIFILSSILFTFASQGSSLTVSGISSGAYMAQQFHVAFSSKVSGAGLIAGGPYFCAQGGIAAALNRCMDIRMGIPDTEASLGEAQKMFEARQVDNPENLADDRVYILSGTEDRTVVQKVSDVVVKTYQEWGVASSALVYVNDLPVGHAFPTENFGNSCSTPSEPPFISRCGRDVAGEILNHLIGPLTSRKEMDKRHLYSFKQLEYGNGLDLDKLSMHEKGYVYIPATCRENNCPIHIAFHGCRQTQDDLGTTFITQTGYNEWAEGNGIIILYPQAKKNFLVNNPKGCWDWWGYGGKNYHTKKGPQMSVVHRIVEALRKKKLSIVKE
ncbi:MAG: polyhydroxybutyrate depolymerase [Bacteriovoracia bacterium]